LSFLCFLLFIPSSYSFRLMCCPYIHSPGCSRWKSGLMRQNVLLPREPNNNILRERDSNTPFLFIALQISATCLRFKVALNLRLRRQRDISMDAASFLPVRQLCIAISMYCRVFLSRGTGLDLDSNYLLPQNPRFRKILHMYRKHYTCRGHKNRLQ
jgi:hypothetical protein